MIRDDERAWPGCADTEQLRLLLTPSRLGRAALTPEQLRLLLNLAIGTQTSAANRDLRLRATTAVAKRMQVALETAVAALEEERARSKELSARLAREHKAGAGDMRRSVN